MKLWASNEWEWELTRFRTDRLFDFPTCQLQGFIRLAFAHHCTHFTTLRKEPTTGFGFEPASVKTCFSNIWTLKLRAMNGNGNWLDSEQTACLIFNHVNCKGSSGWPLPTTARTSPLSERNLQLVLVLSPLVSKHVFQTYGHWDCEQWMGMGTDWIQNKLLVWFSIMSTARVHQAGLCPPLHALHHSPKGTCNWFWFWAR